MCAGRGIRSEVACLAGVEAHELEAVAVVRLADDDDAAVAERVEGQHAHLHDRAADEDERRRVGPVRRHGLPSRRVEQVRPRAQQDAAHHVHDRHASCR